MSNPYPASRISMQGDTMDNNVDRMKDINSGSNVMSNVGSNVMSNVGSIVGSNVGLNVGSNVQYVMMTP